MLTADAAKFGEVRRIKGARDGFRIFKRLIYGGQQRFTRAAGLLFGLKRSHLGIGKLSAVNVRHQAIG